MSKRFALFASAALVALAAAVTPAPVQAQMSEKTVTVGGAPMYPSKNIIQNAVNSKDHTTLVAAVKAAGLVDTLEGRPTRHLRSCHQAHRSPHFVPDRKPPNSPERTSISANRCISGSSRCAGMFGISS